MVIVLVVEGVASYCKEGRGGNTKLIAAANRETGTCQKDAEKLRKKNTKKSRQNRMEWYQMNK